VILDDQASARMERQQEEAHMRLTDVELARLSQAKGVEQLREREQHMSEDPMAWRHALTGFNPASAKANDRAKNLQSACDRLKRRLEIVAEGFGRHTDEVAFRSAVDDLSDAAKSFTASLGIEFKASIDREKKARLI
jgi:hypothetical protein